MQNIMSMWKSDPSIDFIRMLLDARCDTEQRNFPLFLLPPGADVKVAQLSEESLRG